MSSWSGSGVVKATPSELRHLPEVRWVKIGLLVVVAAVVVIVPRGWSSSSQLLAAVAMTFALTGISLVVLTGWGGHISLGQVGILGVGAFVTGNLLENDVDLFLALLAAGAAGAVVAVLVGLPALRIPGLFLAVTTLALAVALDQYFLSPDTPWVTDLVPFIQDRPVLWERFDLTSYYQLYVLTTAFVGLAALAALGVRGARSGRVVIASRDNERAADAAAVPTVNVKLSAFLLAGAMAGIAGGFHFMLVPIGVSSYTPDLSLNVFTTAVIGGLGSITGAVTGVLAFQWLGTWQALGQWRLVVTGVGLLVVLYAVPGGIGQVLFDLRDRYLRWVANRRGIVVPSLVADKRVEGVADHAADEVDLLKGALTGAPVGAGR
jgi:branched-chain amino acid transport system permease protein